MARRVRTWLPVVLVATLACATRWTPRTSEPSIVLQWPYQPNRAKVTYVRSLMGFSRQKGSGAALKSVVFGSDAKSADLFALPVAVATGADGRMAVADLGLRCVHLYIPQASRYIRLAGTKEEPLLSPVAVAFDDALRLYAADSAGRLYAYSPDGRLLRVQRSVGTQALQRPTGLAYSPAKKVLYVVDTLANQIHALDPDGNLVFSFGSRGQEPGQFNFPTHIFRSGSGELYVTDALNFRIDIFDESGKPLGSFGHHGDGSGDMAMPKGLAVDRDGAIYVADSLFDNVQLFDRQGQFLLTVGRRGTEPGELWLPSGVFINDNDELYVCDTYNGRIQVFRITERYANGA